MEKTPFLFLGPRPILRMALEGTSEASMTSKDYWITAMGLAAIVTVSVRSIIVDNHKVFYVRLVAQTDNFQVFFK